MPEITEMHSSPPAPQVVVGGVSCKRGHFNDPEALFCAQCGIGLVQQTLNIVRGVRPSLGVLVLDDGSAYLLDGDYVVGREPEKDVDVREGRARPLVMADAGEIVSRTHLGVQLRGWDVQICDRGSANGTRIIPTGMTESFDLIPFQPASIRPGTRVLLGGQRSFVYDSHHHV